MIEKKEVENIANLARIDFSPKEIETFRKELSVILDYFKVLDEVDVSGVVPFFNLSLYKDFIKKEKDQKTLFGGFNLARKDDPVKTDSQKLIDSAPDKKDKYFKVKEIF